MSIGQNNGFCVTSVTCCRVRLCIVFLVLLSCLESSRSTGQGWGRYDSRTATDLPRDKYDSEGRRRPDSFQDRDDPDDRRKDWQNEDKLYEDFNERIKIVNPKTKKLEERQRDRGKVDGRRGNFGRGGSTYRGSGDQTRNRDRGNTGRGPIGSDRESAFQYDYKYDPRHNSRYDYTSRYRPTTTRPKFQGVWNNPNDPETWYNYEEYWREDLMGAYRSEFGTDVETVTVQTGLGTIQGFYVKLFDGPGVEPEDRPGFSPIDRVKRVVKVFLGIPYAEPPIEGRRFQPPQPHPGQSLYQAVDYGDACPQPAKYTGITKGIRSMSEECLYLNIFAPSSEESSVAEKYPVIVFFHDGDFEHGSSSQYPFHQLVAWYSVIVVTVNYRLGALGFLCTADEHSPGNYGAMDQALAIDWVYKNIHVFDGDPGKITTMGSGAGAASASVQMLSHRARKYVNGVIAMSGSALADWGVIVDRFRAANTSKVFGEAVGCSTESSWKLMDCLKRRKNFDEMANAHITPDLGYFAWAPVVDKDIEYEDDWVGGLHQTEWYFLEDTPLNLLREKVYNKDISLMTGINRHDAGYFLTNNKSLAPDYEIDQDFFDQQIKEFVHRYNYTLNPEGIYNAIKYMYTYWPNPHNETAIRELFIHWLTDALYFAPVDQLAKEMLKNGDSSVFMYVQNTTVEPKNLREWSNVPHGLEYYFITGAPFMDPEFFPEEYRIERRHWTEGDRNMSEFFMSMIANFARYGHPTPVQVFETNWEPAQFGKMQYLNINNTFNSTVKEAYRQTEAGFWTYYLPTVIGRLVATEPPTTELWWEVDEPVEVALWSVSGACLLCIIIIFVCCCLWCSAKKRKKEKYFNSGYLPDDVMIQENHHAEINKSSNLKLQDSEPSLLTKIPESRASSRAEMLNGTTSEFMTTDSRTDLTDSYSQSSTSVPPGGSKPVVNNVRKKQYRSAENVLAGHQEQYAMHERGKPSPKMAGRSQPDLYRTQEPHVATVNTRVKVPRQGQEERMRAASSAYPQSTQSFTDAPGTTV